MLTKKNIIETWQSFKKHTIDLKEEIVSLFEEAATLKKPDVKPLVCPADGNRLNLDGFCDACRKSHFLCSKIRIISLNKSGAIERGDLLVSKMIFCQKVKGHAGCHANRGHWDRIEEWNNDT